MAKLIIFLAFVHLSIGQLQWIWNNYTDHPCKRPCNGVTKTCYYKFVAEYVYTMVPNCQNCMHGVVSDCDNPECIVGDSRRRMLITFNRMYPGPSVEVCQGDQIIADVLNLMDDTVTTVHWHGIHQRGSQWMDGVAMVTQCPINPHATFRYNFVATEAGTHFYHTHVGLGRVEGLYGPFIVRVPRNQNVHRPLYDRDLSEHVISLNDLYKETALQHFWSSIREKIFNWKMIVAVMINGRASKQDNNVPPRIFYVQRGLRYRFRVLHAGGEVCPIELSIQGHNLTVISSDGSDFKPVTVDRLFIMNGERYDFVLNANQPVDTYLIRIVGSIICNDQMSYALLKYVGAPDKKIVYKDVIFPSNTMSLNCANERLNSKCYSYNNLTSINSLESNLRGTPDFKYYIGFDVIDYAKPLLRGVNDDGLTAPFINNITNYFPSSPLLLNPDHRNQRLCNAENLSAARCDGIICECTHYVPIPYNALVELIFVDEGRNTTLVHPFHIHGYDMRVIGYEKLAPSISTQKIRQLDVQGKLMRNFSNPIAKDTISVPSGGYTITRFRADNKGIWSLHCHINFHAEEGMVMFLQVGPNGAVRPPKNFPNCGDYLG